MTRRNDIALVGRRWCASILALLVAMTCWTPASPEDAPTASLRDLKAAYVVHFLRYVEWPEEYRAPSGQPLVIGVVGSSATVDALERLASESIAGHPVRITHVNPGREAVRCHLLFVNSSNRHVAESAVRAVEGTGTLTVGDMDGFLGVGGMIELRVVDNSVRFEVNLSPSTDAGLNISSKLLRLALRIENADAVGMN